MSRVFIIAEAGVNHNGSLEMAKEMVDVAAKAGVDAVKFQTFKAERLVDKDSPKADYQKASGDPSESQFAMIKKLELDEHAHQELFSHCKKQNVKFLSTPFDLESIDLLDQLGLQVFKIPSGEITNGPYLQKIAGLGKPVILSTGMASLGEVEDAISVLNTAGLDKENLTILHANTEYPTPYQDVNLKAMVTMGNAFGLNYGYSDHTLGIEVDIAAVAMGACCIEKHFTLDRGLEGPDHKASLEPEELSAMVRSIRNIEMALGDGVKRASPSEVKNIHVARKYLVTNGVVKKGETFTSENLSSKRIGRKGISPMRWEEIIGQVAQRDYATGEAL